MLRGTYLEVRKVSGFDCESSGQIGRLAQLLWSHLLCVEFFSINTFSIKIQCVNPSVGAVARQPPNVFKGLSPVQALLVEEGS